MGNRFSFGSYGLFSSRGFIQFWLGSSKGVSYFRYPACSDELLDLSFETSEVLNQFLMKDLSRPNGFASLDDTVGAAPPSVVIVPYVLRSCAYGASGLPAMSLIEQMSFFAENVMMVVISNGRTAVIPMKTFLGLHVLLLRYLEMLKTAENFENQKDEIKHFCSICLGDCPDLVVLSCSHELCRRCHCKWVQRRLSCPFCREGFQRQSVHRSSWELLEWRPKDIMEDVRALESELDVRWKEMHFGADLDLSLYEKMKPFLDISEDVDGVLVVDLKSNAMLYD